MKNALKVRFNRSLLLLNICNIINEKYNTKNPCKYTIRILPRSTSNKTILIPQ